MPRVTFTANLRRLVDCPSADVPGGTVGEALAAVFARSPTLRGYIVDCNVDLKVVFASIDSQPVWQYLNLCNLKKIRLAYDAMSGIPTATYNE